MSNSRMYNFLTKTKHQFLHRPIRMRVLYDIRPKQPQLTVVFLHGIAATSETWKTTLRQFSKLPDLANVRLVALDLLGFGSSLQADWLDYDYDDYDRALDATLKHLKIKTPVVLVGHSMGSLIPADYVTNFAASTNVVGLILVSPPVLMSTELAKLPDKAYTKSYSSLHRLAKEDPAIEVIANFIQRFSNFRSKYLKTPAFAKSMDNIILNTHNYRTFASLKVPTLIIHGHFDPLVMRSNLKRIADINSRHVRFVSVMGHHDISAQKRDKIFTEIKHILREVKQNETI